MANDSEWFQGNVAEEQHERCYWRRIGFLIFTALALAAIFAPLMGCATKEGPRQEVCSFQLLGQTSSGLPVVALTCVSPESFAESQK